MTYSSTNIKVITLILMTFSSLFINNASGFDIRITTPVDEQVISESINIIAEMFRNKSNKNMSYSEIDQLFEKTKSCLPSEMLKVIAYHESGGWQQFDENGNVYKGINYKIDKTGKVIVDPKTRRKEVESTDYGIMQINNKYSGLEEDKWDFTKIMQNTEYNITAGVAVIESKKKWIEDTKNKPKKWKRWTMKYDLAGHSDTEILLKAYNGFRKSWEYVDMVKAETKKKAWEKEVDVQLAIDKKVVKAIKLKRNEILKHYWDIEQEDDGKHKIAIKATTKINKKNRKYRDTKNVRVKKDEAEEENREEIRSDQINIKELKAGEGIINGWTKNTDWRYYSDGRTATLEVGFILNFTIKIKNAEFDRLIKEFDKKVKRKSKKTSYTTATFLSADAEYSLSGGGDFIPKTYQEVFYGVLTDGDEVQADGKTILQRDVSEYDFGDCKTRILYGGSPQKVKYAADPDYGDETVGDLMWGSGSNALWGTRMDESGKIMYLKTHRLNKRNDGSSSEVVIGGVIKFK
ncbi:hypothetical protein K8S19_12160 [bacterium]|nr:hypothetical protein [bacterium]